MALLIIHLEDRSDLILYRASAGSEVVIYKVKVSRSLIRKIKIKNKSHISIKVLGNTINCYHGSRLVRIQKKMKLLNASKKKLREKKFISTMII